MLSKAVLATLALASAFSPRALATDTAQSSLYAVNAAALAAAMTYCDVRHNGLQRGSAGAACFSAARSALAEFGLRKWSEDVGKRCSDKATFNTCLTPEVARLVRALNEEFKRKQL